GAHPEVIISVANYVHNGEPVDDGRGIYGTLAYSCDRLRAAMSDAVDRPVTLRFVHDGTASAAAVSDGTTSAVITLGTWLGIGFTPVASPRLIVDKDFTLVHTDQHQRWRDGY